MALLPIIYTSLLVVLGLFLLVFSFSYISYRMRKVPVKASYSHNANKPTQEKIKIKLKEASVPVNHPVLHNEKEIVVIREERNIEQDSFNVNHRHQQKTLRKKDRFSIIKADDVRKFNHIPENYALNSFTRTSAIPINDFQNGDIFRFYDE